MNIHSRILKEKDFQEMKDLLLRDGPNEWNFLNEESIEHQFQLIKEGSAEAILAENDELLGFSVLIYGESCPDKLKKYTDLSSIAYINDVVVSKNHSGKGIGSKLLTECISIAKSRNYKTVYVERHEENLASAGMMAKAGFEVVEIFFDPNKRFVGSKNTSVLKKCT
jgi:ribosomal protein S18 acetylase RimI-like enzyme